MSLYEFLDSALYFLGAGIVGAFVFKKLGFGSVVGYLIAGILIGPSALGLINDVEAILHFSELGIIILLFVIGLELSPQRLWQSKHITLGFGPLQVLSLGPVLAAGIWWAFDISVGLSLLLGFGFALSSTALVVQILAERNELSKNHGRYSFGTLLFQDMAAIPLIGMVPLFSQAAGQAPTHMGSIAISVVSVIIVFAIVFWGVEPVLRRLAKLQLSELLLAASLFIVVALAGAMHSLGLSMALGAFLGGVALSQSSYRYSLEASLEPFKSLLMALFFISVGMSIHLQEFTTQPLLIICFVGLLMLVKFMGIFALAKVFKQPNNTALRIAINLCQAGEFVFIILSLMGQFELLSSSLLSIFNISVGLSMLVTPLLIQIVELIVNKKTASDADTSDLLEPQAGNAKVLVIGYGRFGQIATRIFKLKQMDVSILDNNPDHIRFVRRFGAHVFFGEASNLETLRKAGAEHAQLVILALDKEEQSLKILEVLKNHYPHLKVFARARNRHHLLRLRKAGVDYAVRDTFYSSLRFTEKALMELGLDYSAAKQAVDLFEERDNEILIQQQEHVENPEEISRISIQWTKEMENLLSEDQKRET